MRHRRSRRMLALFSLPLFFICVSGSAHRLSSSSDPADVASTTIRPEVLRADMRFLADDLLEPSPLRADSCSLKNQKSAQERFAGARAVLIRLTPN
jgi:hypothetical protein